MMIDKPVINTDLKKYDKAYVVEDDILWEVFGDGYSQAEVIWDKENICELLNEQQSTISALKEENEKLRKGRDESDKFIVKKGLETEFLEWCMK